MCEKCRSSAAAAAAKAAQRAAQIVQAAAKAVDKAVAASDAAAGKAAGGGEDGPIKDKFVVCLQLKGIGGTPLVNEKVVLVDSATGEQVGEPLVTDDEGRVRTEVPEEKKYDLRIVSDEEPVPEPEPADPMEATALLMCRFVDVAGFPVAGEKVKITDADSAFEAVTSSEGEIDQGVEPGPYELEIKGERFHAHTLFARDVDENGAQPYVFVLGEEPYDPDEFADAVHHSEANEDVADQLE